MLLWLVARLIRLLGWRRGLELLVRGAIRWRVIAIGLWRAAMRLSRLRALLAGRP